MRWYSVSALSNFEKKVAEPIRDAAPSTTSRTTSPR